MLVVTPSSPQTALGIVLSALIVILSLIGLTLHGDFYAGNCRRDYWVYYTNQSNLLVFLYFAVVSPVIYSISSLQALIPHAEYALMLSIMLTHLVFHHFLSPFMMEDTAYMPHASDDRFMHADSMIQHYLVPLMTFSYWLLCSPGKFLLDAADAVLWLVFPIGYTAFVFIRARIRGTIHRTKSAYPYPFLDIDFFGAGRVFRLCALLLLLCGGAGLCGVMLVRAGYTLCALRMP